MAELLDVRHLTKKFAKRREIMGSESLDLTESMTAVDSVTFGVSDGEAVGLVGQSGSGKTTIGKLITRLETPTSGQILFEKRDVSQLKGRRLLEFRKKVQMIFQDPYESLDPRLTIEDTLTEPLEIHGTGEGQEKSSRVKSALTMVGLAPAEKFLTLRPHQLSGGQRQRVAIARSLILEPKLIVADEPLSMLDVSVSADILNLMLELRNSMNVSYLFITHNLGHAAYFCDRIIVLNEGKIVEEGPAEQLLKSPRHHYTKTLIDSILLYNRNL